LPPTGDPTPPVDTPTDPDTSEPEPGVDPDFAEPTRIEITGQKQTVIRTEADPGTWGNAYIAAELGGYDYWEIHISSGTPRNATLAVGVSNLDLPLNGIPGDEAETVAYWSSGVVRNNGADTSGFPTFGRGDKIGVARDKDTGRIWFAKNGTWLGSTPVVGDTGHQGTLTGSGPYYPFTALYSGGTSVTFKFAASKFAYSVPSGFYPIGQTPTVFPTVQTRQTGQDASAVSTHPITIPTGVQPGDLILVAFVINGTATVSIASGTNWSIFDQDVSGSATHAILHKVADGSDALSIGTTISGRGAYAALRISGAAGTVSGDGVGATFTTSPNPPNHAPAGGSKKYLWVATTSVGSPRNISAAPSNYVNLQSSGNVASTPNVATAERTLQAASEDPGAFTTQQDSYYSRTLAIAPA